MTEQDPQRILTEDERAELESLRAQVAELRAEVSSVDSNGARPLPAKPRRRRTWPRTTAGYVLIALAALLAPLGVVSVWARSQVTDTDRYVETVAPLASDPAVQSAVTTNITNVVFQYFDVQGLTQQAIDALSSSGRLPPAATQRLDSLVGPITNGVRNFTQSQVSNVVQSQAFADAWVTANRTAHDSLVAALTGDTSGPVQVQGDTVSVQLATLINTVKQRLVSQGFSLAERIPAVNAQFTIFQSADIPKIQRGYNLLNNLGYWLPFIVLGLGVIGIYVVPHHRRAAIVAGLALAAGMLLVAILLALARHRYLDAVPPAQLPPDAAAVLFDTVVRFLREALRAIALIGVILAAGAFLTGPSVTATAVRRACTRVAVLTRTGLGRLGLHMPAVTNWVAPRAGTMRAVAVAVGVILLIVPAYLTPAIVGWVVLGLVVVLFVVAVLAAPDPPRRPAGTAMPAADIPVAAG
jgi:hypothetical protein